MCRQLVLLLTIFQVFVVVGCATMPTHYQAKTFSKEDSAEVRSTWCHRRVFKQCDVPDVLIRKIDGIDAWPWSPSHLYAQQIVDPGERILVVSGSIATDIAAFNQYWAETELRVMLKAGHSYLIHGEWLLPVMTFWVEDKTTGDIVSEKQSVNALPHKVWLNLIPRK